MQYFCACPDRREKPGRDFRRGRAVFPDDSVYLIMKAFRKKHS